MPNGKAKVSDYMQSRVVTLPPTATLKEAVQKMIAGKTNGMVAVDENNKVVGILSSWDIIQHIVPNYLEEDKHLASFEAGDVFAQRVLALQHDPIAKFMSTNVHTCKAGHYIMEAAALLSEFKIRQLPVVDDNNILIGYINRTDIKKAMADILGVNKE